MRLFWRDQLSLIAFTLVQLAAVTAIFWLDGYDSLKIAAYALLIGLCVLAAYLAFRYYTHRRMYRLLEQGHPNLDESVQSMDYAPLPGALEELLQAQYRHYQNRISENERKQFNHITFMNQWVHQMKTPLSVLELMLQDGAEPRDESMREETERIRKGLEMVLYMARLETFEQDFSIDKVSLREAVNEVILDNKRLFIRSFVYPDMQIEEDIKVDTDGKWLRFIIQQLISNAVKYSAGSREKVVVRAYTRDRAVILEVVDSGVGIPPSDLSRIFQPFFTGENGRAFKESTGMGLYIVKSVIDKMNHELQVESQLGHGTTARIIFPYAAS
ncbi:Sensor histidine kinase GraS [compost metagenome]